MRKNFKRGVRLLILITIILIGDYLFKDKILAFNNNKIDKVLQTKEYSYLPKEAINYIKDIYEETGEIVLTEKNKKENTPYLNPRYINYLTLSDEEKGDIELIPDTYILDYTDIQNTPNNTVLPSQYDLRNVDGKSYITLPKNQGSLPICWAFATIEQAESYIMVKNKEPYNDNSKVFSVRQLDYATSKDGIKNYNNEYGTRNLTSGADFQTSIIALANGVSLIDNSKMPYNYSWEQKELKDVLNYYNSNYETNSTIEMPSLTPENTTTARNNYIMEVKQKIMENGGAFISTVSPQGSCSTENYYESNKYIIKIDDDCLSDKNSGAHAMHVIGWDDDYTYKYCKKGTTNIRYKDNEYCSNPVTGKGAWIVRNSWSSSAFKYVYLAYDSNYYFIKFISDMTETSNKTWDNAYVGKIVGNQYYRDSITKEYERKVSNPEKIDKIKFFALSQNGRYRITINDEYSKEVTTTSPGLYTVDLSNLNIIINKNSFRVKIESLNDTYLEYNVFVYTNNVENNSIIIKTEDKILSARVANENGYIFNLYSITRNIPSNGEIIYKIFKNNVEVNDKMTYTNNYIAENNINTDFTINSNIEPGEYTLRSYYKKGSQEITCDNCTSIISLGETVQLNGNGTSSSPYLINNQEELALMKYDLSADYKLNADIEITGDWEPIGTDSLPFTGNFNGNNHTISNLKVKDSLYGGLFGVISNKDNPTKQIEIKKLKLKNFNINGNSYAGALVAKVNNIYGNKQINFTDIYIYDSTISSENGNIGSVVGQINCNNNLPYIIFKNIFSNATLIGGEYSGGIIGMSEYATMDLGYIQFVGELITNDEIKDKKNHGTIFNYQNFSGVEPEDIDSNYSITDSTSNGLIIGKDYLYTHITNFGFEEPNYNLCTFSYLKKQNDIYSYNLSLEDSYTEFNSILDMKDINKYNYEIDEYDWQFKTIDGISRIPVLRGVDFEYTTIDDISLNVGETVNLLDYITPDTKPCRLSIDTTNTSDVITVENSNESICDYDINITGNKIGTTTLHIISDYDGYEKDININVSNFIKGDMNNNNKIDLKDIILLIRKYIGSEETTTNDIAIGDMNNNNKLDLKDIILLIRAYLGTN